MNASNSSSSLIDRPDAPQRAPVPNLRRLVCGLLFGLGLLLTGTTSVCAQDLDEFEIDVPRPLKGSLEIKRTNEVTEVELSLDAGYRHLLGKQKSPLAYGAIPVDGAGDKSEYDLKKVRVAKLLMSGRNLEADALLVGLMKQRIDDIDIHCLRATSALYQKEYDNSEEIVKRILRMQPLHPTALFLQLCLQQTKTPVPDPVHDWSNSRLVQTEMFVTWLDHSRVNLLRTLTPDQFAEVCTIVIGPNSQDRLGQLADSLKNARQFYGEKDYSNSLVFYDLAKTHGLVSEALFLRTAECLFRLKQYPEALNRLEKLVRVFPDNAHFWHNKGLVHMHLKQYADAAPAFETAWEKSPRHGMFGFAHACSLVAQNKKDEAWPILKRVARDFPGPFETWAEGDAFYLRTIRADDRYAELIKPPADPNGSRR